MPENREDFPVDAETAWRQCDEERRELLIANDGLAKERDEAHKTILALERGYREVSAALQATQVAEKYDRFARKLDELAALPEGWDSYGATRITPAAVEAVRGLLSVLAIVPCSSGGLQVEFHALGWDFELEVEADGSVASVICEERTGARTAPATPSAGPALGALVERDAVVAMIRQRAEAARYDEDSNGADAWLTNLADDVADLPPTEATPR